MLPDATGKSLRDGNCVNGLAGDSIFGQFAACNAVAFWAAVNKALQQGAPLSPPIPALGLASDGLPWLVGGINSSPLSAFTLLPEATLAFHRLALLFVRNCHHCSLTSRDFALVDMDPSDNVPTRYLLTPDGKTAALNPMNQAALPTATIITNGSDEALLILLNKIMGCNSYQARDVGDPTIGLNLVPSLGLNELSAAVKQK